LNFIMLEKKKLEIIIILIYSKNKKNFPCQTCLTVLS